MLPHNIKLPARVVDARVARVTAFFVMALHLKPVADLCRYVRCHFATCPSTTGAITRQLKNLGHNCPPFRLVRRT